MGKSSEYAFYYKIFLKTSPLIILLVDDSLNNKKYITTFIACISLLLSGTRANVLILTLYILSRIFFDVKIKKTYKILISFILFGIIVYNLSNITFIITDIMNKKGSIESDRIRNGLMSSYKIIFSDIKNLILGTGYNSSFYNLGTKGYTTTGEYSYLELIRQIGIIFFTIFIIFIIIPLKNKIKASTKIAYIGYLIIAYTNPLLFSSTGFAAFTYMYTLEDKNTENKLTANNKEVSKKNE